MAIHGLFFFGDMQALSRSERALLALATAVLGAFWLSAAWRHPGFGTFDEEGLISVLQFHHEGEALPWGLFRWTLWLRLQALVSALDPGNVLLLRLPALFLLLGELFLLHRVVRRRGGEQAAAWAVAADTLTASSFLRSQSLLPWGATPFWALLIADAMDRWRGSAWKMAALGAGTAALLFEYEAWPMAAFWLALEAWRGPGATPSSARTFAGGVLLGSSACLGLSWGQLPSYLRSRASLSSVPDDLSLAGRIVRNLSALVLPQARIGFLGPDSHPLLPPWSWAPLLLGALWAWRRARHLLPAFAAALIPAVSVHTAEETNRYVMAGLLASMLAGYGLGQAALRIRLLAPLALLAGLGGFFEWRAADFSLDAARVRTFARSLQWQEAARRLGAQAPKEGWELISGLGEGDDAAFRFLCRRARVPLSPQGRPVALLNWELLPVVQLWRLPFDRSPRPLDQRSCTLLYPDPALSSQLRTDAARLAPLHRAVLFERAVEARERIRRFDAGGASPLLRTALAGMDFGLSCQLRDLDPERIKQVAAGPLVSAEIPLYMADKLEHSDPSSAAVYARLALRIDPRRAEALEMLERLKERESSKTGS